MANDGVIEIDVVAKLDTIEKQLSGLESTVEKQGEKVGGKIASGVFKGLVGFEIAKKIFNTLSSGISGAVDEAIAAERSLNLFNQSLANVGNFTQEASNRFQEFAKGLQQVTSFSDDLIISNASILASLGKLSGDGLERATKAALDFASTGRVSLEGAFDAVAKAANGNTTAISKFVGKIDESLPAAGKFEAALKLIENRFGGLAEAQGATFGGTLDRIKNQFSDIGEEIGKMVTQSPALVAILGEVSKILSAVGAEIAKLGSSGDFIGVVINNLLVFGQAIVQYVLAPLELVTNLLTSVFSAAKLAFDAINLLSGGTIDAVKQSFEALKLSTDNIFNFEKSAQVDTFLQKLQTVAANAPAVGAAITNNIGGAFDAVAVKASKAAEQINKTFQQGVINTISVGAQAIGSSLVKGGKAFENFGKQVLNIIGDMAIQIGSTLIGVGIGIEALKLALGTLSGGQAIAAGLALVALGGLLKSLSGGGDTSGVGAGTVGSGGGASPDVGGGAFAATAPDEAVREAGSKVVVNVEGNVFNQRETGLEIARIIQDQFDLNGQVTAQGGINA